MMSAPGRPDNPFELGRGPVSLSLTTTDGGRITLRPGKVVCCGHNYGAHIAEMGRVPPEHPNLFSKFPQTLTTRPTIEIDEDVDADWEAELVAVIGAPVSRLSADAAAGSIAGFTIANDVSMRDRQSRVSQWLSGKAFDATTPIGPTFVRTDEWHPSTGELWCRVNGDTVQHASTGDLIFSAAQLASSISQFAALEPGDLILTGTPGGVGSAQRPPRYLRDDDLVECEISGIGVLRTRIAVRSTPLGRRAQ